MSIPASINGYGSSVNQEVLAIYFNYPLSSKPTYEAYDGSTGAFPATGPATATTYKIFLGSTANGNLPMVALHDVTEAPPAGTNWFPGSATGGAANPNRMKGKVNYVQCSTIPQYLTNVGTVRFNIQAEIPCDVYPTMSTRHDLVIRYTYTSTIPVVTWKFNEGSEETPTWTTIVPDTNGIRHCRSGTAGGGPYLANIPDPAVASLEKTLEGWVTT